VWVGGGYPDYQMHPVRRDLALGIDAVITPSNSPLSRSRYPNVLPLPARRMSSLQRLARSASTLHDFRRRPVAISNMRSRKKPVDRHDPFIGPLPSCFSTDLHPPEPDADRHVMRFSV